MAPFRHQYGAMNASTKTRFTVRLEPGIKEAIEIARRQRVGSISTNTWIAEAISEKLARETPKKAVNA